MSEFLKENDIKVIRVTKLTAREEWQKNSAAFHVSVDFNDRVKCLVQTYGLHMFRFGTGISKCPLTSFSHGRNSQYHLV